MAYWEFLLQKEGDRDWLPLETAHVEISEGRYRIIAHSSYCQTNVNICLSRLLTEQMPPQRKTLKRIGTTNENGLMVVIPFTHLTPGLWTVTCTADQDAVKASWEFGVQLEVLAIESGVEYWDTELDEASLAEPLTNQSSTSVEDSWPVETPSTPAANWPELNAIANEPLALQTPIEDLPLRLQLQHQALVAQTAIPLSLQGQVTTFSQVEGLAGEGTLWVQLRNPETGAVVHQSTQALSITSLPSRFEVVMPLPEESTTRLLVGELSLWTASEPPQVLAIQGFTVTLNLDALLELVANQAESALPTNFEDLTVPLSTDDGVTASSSVESAATISSETAQERVVANPLSPRSVPFRLIYLPTSGLTLPPVIYRPIDKKTVGSPTLPLLSDQPRRDRPKQLTNLEAPDEAPAASPAKPLTLPPIGSKAKSSPSTPIAERPAESASSLELPTMGSTPATSEEVATAADAVSTPQNPNPTTTPSTPIQKPFEPDLQGRFWTRLSALAEEAQKAAADYKAQLDAAGVRETATTADTGLSSDAAAIAGAPSEPVNYEVVVYDSEDEPVVSGLNGSPADSEPVIEVLQPGEPDRQELGEIPVPDWVFPQGDLVAGAPLPITIQLPAYPRRLAVKVWVTDIQSRTLVDRPRWLMNWTSTPEGDQTAFLQLQVPLGSIEARFEAIAIDLATQQESYKTSIVREILPTNLPASDADESL